MTMNDPLMLVVAGLAGFGLGIVFFGGLWWTVRRAILSSRPALWFLGSMMLRMGIVVAGFYYAGGGQWQRLLLCMPGFVLARLVVMRFTRVPDKNPNSHTEEPHHAS
jgi:F1F0 ATPase subunit 2